MSVVGDLESARFLSVTDHGWRGKASALLLDPPTFAYLVYPGRYRLKLTYCGPDSCSDPSLHESVFTDFISVPSRFQFETSSLSARHNSNQFTIILAAWHQGVRTAPPMEPDWKRKMQRLKRKTILGFMYVRMLLRLLSITITMNTFLTTTKVIICLN